VSDPQLGPDEDSELRRLHVLRGFGMVTGSIVSRYEALRDRDRRKGVRDPDEATIVAPVEKPEWRSSRPAEPKPASVAHPQRAVTDTREIFGTHPEPRRGRGIFRR
jgi:hypothetical protein